MAYCNKDLNSMLREYLGDPSVHIYTNEEYARFSKVYMTCSVLQRLVDH